MVEMVSSRLVVDVNVSTISHNVHVYGHKFIITMMVTITTDVCRQFTFHPVNDRKSTILHFRDKNAKLDGR